MDEEVRHPFFARLYIWMSKGRDPEEKYRRRLLAGAQGRVIEVGAGNGLNFAHYPPEVTEVVAIEPEPRLREEAIKAARNASVAIEVKDGVAGTLPAEDGSFDTAVASLVLCSVPDQVKALAEISRVIKPDGNLHFYEHVIAREAGPVRFMRFADATFWPHLAGGCHMSRDTTSAIEAAGFEIDEIDRFPFSPARFVPSLPHVLGRASRPRQTWEA